MTTLTKDHNNHPAHAPLTSRRLHQMRDILSKAAAQRDGGDIGYAMSDAVKVIDEVLARRAAAFEATFPRENPDIIDECVPIQDMETSQMRESLDARYKIMLEAAPQPAPVVPEPIKRNDADGWWMYKGRRVGGGCAEWYNRALDDCRASMLQGKPEPVSDPYKMPATLIKAMQSAIDQLDRRAGKVERGYPQHSHSVSGVWDQSNGRIANEPCSVCALWDEMREYLSAAPQQEVIGIDLASGKDASFEVVIENGKVISHG